MYLRTAAILFLLFMATGPAHAEGGQDCRVFSMGGGAYDRGCSPSTDHDGSWEFDCRTGRCMRCGVCHAAPATAKPEYELSSHVTRFPYPLRNGERVPWADGKVVATTVKDRICIVAPGGKNVYCFPANAIMVRDPSGKPAGIVTPLPAKRLEAPALIRP